MTDRQGGSCALVDAVERSQRLRPRTKQLYLEHVRAFVAFAGGTPEKWTCGAVEDWRDAMLKRGLKAQSVNTAMKGVRYASRRIAERSGGATVNFAVAAEACRVEETPQRIPLTIMEAKRLIETCSEDSSEDIRDRALIVIGLKTGLRRGGICGLDIKSIQPPQITAILKGGKPITLVADDETLAAVRDWVDVLAGWGVHDGALFRSVSRQGVGKRLSTFQIWAIIKRRAQAAGIRHIHPHLLRHTCVTWAKMAGVPSMYVRTLTGQTEQTIDDVYTHPDQSGAPVGAALPRLL